VTAAAIFDLDRTLIPKPSGPVLQRHLVDAGITESFEIPGLATVYRAYELIGENPGAMQMARLAVRAAKGWPVEEVVKAATAAADELYEMVLPYGRLLIDEHRAAGRRVALATTTPDVLVRPLAERLGVDEVIATKWAIEDGCFTGRIDGRFLWGRNKLGAVKAWAREEGIDLAASYAYSDSVFDVPLLRSVGTPVAVNPDAQLAVIANLNRWQIRHLDVPPGVVKFGGRELQEWLRPLNRPETMPYARFDIQGTENVPAKGAAILVFNHRSYFDSAAVNFTLAKAGRPARFLGKKEVFDAPIIGPFTRMFGGIRVDRGTGSDEPLEKAIEALLAGQLVSMAPQGTIPRGPAFFEPELKGRWGAARLAHATKAPVIPVGIWGTEKVWPRNRRFPHMWPSEPPMITVRVGGPVELRYRSVDADTRRIMEAIVDLLPAEAREHHVPTEEELALTYPPGYAGDPTQEAERRPGTDT
jgi:putative phosphoserine phosphatase/1-acylglycerol-3-phosphate O-acyltransferase